MEQKSFIYLLWEKILRNFTLKYLKTNILALVHSASRPVIWGRSMTIRTEFYSSHGLPFSSITLLLIKNTKINWNGVSNVILGH